MTTQNLGHSIAALLRLRMGKTRPRILFGAMLFGAALWLVGAPQALAQGTSPDPIVFTNADITPADRALHVSWTLGANVVGGSVATSGTFISWRTAETTNPAAAAGAWREDVVVSAPAGPYVITPLTNGVVYDVRLISEGNLGAADSTPTIATGTPAAPTAQANAPDAPTALVTSSISTTGLTISWTASATTGTNAATGYQVRWAVAGTADWQDASGDDTDCTDGDDTNDEDCGVQVLNAAGQTLAITGLAVGTEYEIEVLAKNATAESSWVALAPLAKTTSTAPDVPATAGAGVTAGKLSLVLTWVVPNNNGEPITQYRYRYDTDGVASTWENSGGATGTIIALADISPIPSQAARRMFTIRGLDSTVTYSSVQIAAENSVGVSAFGSLGNATSPNAGTAPGTATNLAAPDGTPLRADLTWTRPADDGGSPILGYLVRWRSNKGTTWVNPNAAAGDEIPNSAPGEANETSYTVTGLTQDGSEVWEFQLQARNAVGNGAWSFSLESVEPGAAREPDAPVLGAIADGPIVLNWTAPAENGGSAITTYHVRWRTAESAPSANDEGAWQDASGDNDDGEDVGDVLTYTIPSTSGGVTYDIQVRAVNAEGNGAWAATSATAPAPTLPAPTLATPIAARLALDISWTAPADTGGATITGYRYRWTNDGTDTDFENASGADGEVIPSSAALTSFTITGLTAAEHKVQLAAESAGGTGTWSDLSDAVTPLGPIAPPAPTDLTISRADTTITVGWTPPTDNGGADITGYRYRWSTDGGTTWNVAVGGAVGLPVPNSGAGEMNATSYTITGLANGMRHTVAIAAANSVVTADTSTANWSATVAATPAKAPDAPAIDTTTGGNGEIDLAWTAPDTGGEPVVEYFVRWAVSTAATDYLNANGAEGQGVGAGTTYTIPGLKNGTTYSVDIAARNAVGTSPFSTVTELTPEGVPYQPRGISLATSNATITATWTPPDMTGGSAITGYLYRFSSDSNPSTYQSANGNAGVPIAGSGATTRTATITTDIANGTTYAVQIAAANTNGTGMWSEAASATPFGAPAKPATPIAVPVPGGATITWVAPANTGGLPITGYAIRWALGSSASSYLNTGGNSGEDGFIIPNSANLRSYTVTNLSSAAHEFSVAAINALGTSVFSDVIAATANAITVPGAPTNVQLVIGATSIGVSWSAPANDGGAAVTYKIRWRDSDDGAGPGAWNDDDGVATADTTSHTIGSLTADTQIDVELIAVNSASMGDANDFAAATAMTATPVAAGDVTLSDLTVTASDGNTLTLSPTFAAARTGYTATLARDLTTAAITATQTDASGSVSVSPVGATEIAAGASQIFTVTVTASGGSTQAYTVVVTRQAALPASPSNVRVTSQDTALAVSWTPPANSAGLIGYRVRWRDATTTAWQDASGAANNGELVAGVTNYRIDGLINGTAYDVQVAAETTVGIGTFSSTQEATPAVVPAAPTLHAPVATFGQLTLTWDAPANPNNAEITGYKYRLAIDSAPEVWGNQGGAAGADTASLTGHTITQLFNNRVYFVQLAAVNAAGTGAWTASRAGEPKASVPDAPTLAEPTPGTMTLTINWTAPANNGGSAVSGYRVRWADNSAATTYLNAASGEDGEVAADGFPIPESAALTAYTITALTNGTLYDVQVAAENSTGTSEWSNLQSATPGTPGAPSILSIAQHYTDTGANALRVHIFPPDTVVLGAAAIGMGGYSFQTKLASETAWTDSVPLSQGLSGASAWIATLGPLTAGATYNVRVRAANSFGAGPWSAIQTRATPATPQITKPTAPVVTAEVFGFTAGAQTGASVATSRANANQRVTLQMRVSGTEFPDIHTGRVIINTETDPMMPPSADVTLSIRSEDITGLTYRAYGQPPLTVGSTFDVRYRLNTAAGVVSPWSDTVSFTVLAIPIPPSAAPGEPTGLAAATATRGLMVTWTAPSDATTTGLTGYDVRWKLASATDYAASDIANATASPHTITGLSIAEYNVQVRSVGPVGNSAWTTAVAATPTAAVPGVPTLNTPIAIATGLALSWTPPADNGGAAITIYNVRHRTSAIAAVVDDPATMDVDETAAAVAAGTWMPLTSTSTSLTISGLTAATSYDIQLNAENGTGEGAWTSTVSATAVAAAADAAPSDITIQGLTPADGGGAPTAADAEAGYTKGRTNYTVLLDNAQTSFTATVTVETGQTGVTISVDGADAIPLTHATVSEAFDLAPGASATAVITVTASGTVATQAYTFVVARQAGLAPAPTLIELEPDLDSLIVTWSAIPDANNGGSPVTGYRVRWRVAETGLTAVGLWQDANGEAAEGDACNDDDIATDGDCGQVIAGADNRTYTIVIDTESTSSQAYEVQVAVTTQGAGTTPLEGAFATTEDGEPVVVTESPITTFSPRVVRNIRVLRKTKESVTVGWDVPAMTGNRDITSYHVRWRTASPGGAGSAGEWENADGDDPNCARVSPPSPDDCGVELAGETLATTYIVPLRDNRLYEVDVRAGNIKGQGIWASENNPVSSLTDAQRVNEAAPSAPTLTLSAVRGIRADWTPPEDTGRADIALYRLRWATAAAPATYINAPAPAGEPGEGSAKNGFTVPGEETARTYTLTGLTDGTIYQVQVAAVGNAGLGEWSEPQTAIPSVRQRDSQIADASLIAFGNAVVASALDVFSNNIPATKLAHRSAANGSGGFLSLGGAELSAQTRVALASEGEIVPIGWDTTPAVREVDWREFLGDTSFRIGLAHNEGAEGMATTGIWGRADVRGYEGRGGTNDMHIEGLSYAAYLGSDYSTEDWTLGVAVSFIFGEADYHDDAQGLGGTTETWLVTGYPYARYSPHEKVDMWATFGFGYGIHSIVNVDGDKVEAPVFQQLYAAGVKIDLAQVSNINVAAKTDVAISLLQLLNSDDMDGSTPQQQRWRFALETDRQMSLPGGFNFHPSAEIAVRIDTGDTDSGEGLELGAGLRLTSASARLSVEARGRGLVAHTVGDTQEWGASLSARVSPDASGGGLSLSFTPGWGQTQSRADAMWANDRTVSDISAGGGTYGWVPNSLRTEMGYGMKQGLALITPVAQYSLSGERQTIGVGTRLALGNALNMELLGERVGELQSFNTDQAYRVSLTSRLRF